MIISYLMMWDSLDHATNQKKLRFLQETGVLASTKGDHSGM
ncbi:MAG: hypothetical protein RLZZ203_826 [Cyanobacteriota bacterium]|jgi:hypothetical protein